MVVFKIRHYAPKVLDCLCEGSIVLYVFLILVNAVLTCSIEKEDKMFGTHQMFNIFYFSTPCVTLLHGRNTLTKFILRFVCLNLGISIVILTETITVLTITASVLGILLIQMWVEITLYYYISSMDRLFAKQIKLEENQKQLNFIVSQIPTGTAILDFKDKQRPVVEYANDAMLKLLRNINKKSDFEGDSIDTKQQYSQQRHLIVSTLESKALSPFSVKPSETFEQKSSILDLVTDPLNDLTDKWRKFLIADRTQAFDRTDANMLIQMHQKAIEFNDKPCEMVFIADRTADLQLLMTKKLNAADIVADS
jgi:hypothetical protein